jgi:hypothetical protein
MSMIVIFGYKKTFENYKENTNGNLKVLFAKLEQMIVNYNMR